MAQQTNGFRGAVQWAGSRLCTVYSQRKRYLQLLWLCVQEQLLGDLGFGICPSYGEHFLVPGSTASSPARSPTAQVEVGGIAGKARGIGNRHCRRAH